MSQEALPPNFNGVVRLFPLPNVVLFPHALQPLHIFESRYIEMTEHALADDGLIAMVLLKPGWEAHYWGKPAIYDVACLGRIRWHERLANGRFNLLLQGLCRFRIENEIPADTRYRQARGWPMPDLEIEVDQVLKRELLREISSRLNPEHPLRETIAALDQLPVPVGVICDILAFALPFELRIKQHLLETLDVEERAHALLRHLRNLQLPELLPMPRQARSFPPAFSQN
ncbi:MAG: LON peptidase substrate-binding domain-containing protein [Gemmatales bacterium]|nr:LON peptidase substrate-binding domain-containing protein [Gemmatales bacterium]MDW7995518.1 LON peptidase substrate-binding domain-containing protein [Gemmatales bacterium]